MLKILNLLLVTFIAKHQTIFYMKLVFWVRKISSVELTSANCFNKVIRGVNLLDDSNFTTVLKQIFEYFCITYDSTQKKSNLQIWCYSFFIWLTFLGKTLKIFQCHILVSCLRMCHLKIQMEKDSSKIEYREESCFGKIFFAFSHGLFFDIKSFRGATFHSFQMTCCSLFVKLRVNLCQNR